MHAYPGPAYGKQQDPNMIEMNDVVVQHLNLIGMDGNDKTITNVFCFEAFADKTSSIIYNDLTGSFLFVLLDRRVCFFVLYHYKSNCILATPISGMNDKKIFDAYTKYSKELTSKGFKPKLNVMDNQATKHIKQCLSKNKCKLQLIKPHSHRVNTAEQTIQTFKDEFIAPITTINVNFPLQLWDKLTPQVQTCLNLMAAFTYQPFQIDVRNAIRIV